MNINDILKLNKSSSVELVDKFNEHLAKPEKDFVQLFLLSVFYISRYSRLNSNVTKEMQPELAVSLFLDVLGKKKTSINELASFVRSEIWGTYEKALLFRIDPDMPYAAHFDQFHCTDEETTEREALLQIARSKIIDLAPIRLVPIIRYYIDTGILATTMLSDSDKFIVLLFLNKLGARMAINSESLADLIPKDVKGKTLFLSALCSSSEETYVILNLLGDIDKLFILSELFGGREIRIPTPEELVATIEDLAVSSDKFKGTDEVSNEFLAMFVKTDPKSVGIQMNVLEQLRGVLESENDNYEKLLSRLSSSPDSKKMLMALTNELNATSTIFQRIQKLQTQSS